MTANKMIAKSLWFTHRYTIIMHSKKFKDSYLQCGSNDAIADNGFQKFVVLLS